MSITDVIVAVTATVGAVTGTWALYLQFREAKIADAELVDVRVYAAVSCGYKSEDSGPSFGGEIVNLSRSPVYIAGVYLSFPDSKAVQRYRASRPTGEHGIYGTRNSIPFKEQAKGALQPREMANVYLVLDAKLGPEVIPLIKMGLHCEVVVITSTGKKFLWKGTRKEIESAINTWESDLFRRISAQKSAADKNTGATSRSNGGAANPTK